MNYGAILKIAPFFVPAGDMAGGDYMQEEIENRTVTLSITQQK